VSRLAFAFVVLAFASPASAQSALLGVLPAAGPAVADSAHLLFAPLRGVWDVLVTDHLPDGKRRTASGEWRFDWVLAGRAMQDVWISPPRGVRQQALTMRAFDRYGTTLRFFDPSISAWRIVWIDPAQNYVATLIGRARGHDIVQEGTGDDGVAVRWTFSNITYEAFTWRGETSPDNGRTWRTVQEMTARRTVSTTTHPSPGLMDALQARGPIADDAGALRLFGQFAGSWESTLIFPNQDGTVGTGAGEIHAGWVLEGRALQDVWIFPRRGEPASSGQEYGTTIRFFDRAAGRWRSIWISPVNHVVREFRVRTDGDEIFLEARTARGQPQRWVFSAITPSSFHWRNIVSPDDGGSWQLRENVSARRAGTLPSTP